MWVRHYTFHLLYNYKILQDKKTHSYTGVYVKYVHTLSSVYICRLDVNVIPLQNVTSCLDIPVSYIYSLG